MNAEIHEEVAVEELHEEDAIDLENDPFADPYGAVGYQEDEHSVGQTWHDYEADHDQFGFEYARVEGVVEEDEDKTCVYTSLINVVFPHGHKVKRLVVE